MQQAVPMQMNPQELPLRAIHLPPEPGFWPLAPGWWILIALLVLIVSVLLILWYRRLKRHRCYLTIISELQSITDAFQNNNDRRQLLTDLSLLLRRFEKYQQHKDQAVALNGQHWIDHLNKSHKGQPFSQWQQLLTEGIYQSDVSFNEKALIKLVATHIKVGVMKPQSGGQYV